MVEGSLGETTGTIGGRPVTLAINGSSLELSVGGAGSDTTAPAAPSLTLLASSDTGSSGTDRITNDTTPTLRITLAGAGDTAPVAGDVVKLRQAAVEVASATLREGDITAGYIDLTSTILAPGSLSFTATVTDTAGNVSAPSEALGVLLDTTAPVISVVGSDTSVGWGSAYSDAGATAADPEGGEVAVVTVNPVDTSTSGVYTVTYSATDAAGNTAQATRTVTVSIENPTVPGADGLSPLMKYAFGATSPSDSVQEPVLHSTATTLSLTAVVRTNDPAVIVSAEAVNDLAGTWGTGGTVNESSASDQGDLPPNTERRVYTVARNGAPKKFLRLKVRLSPHASTTQPNFIFIIADDLGIGDLGAYGATLIPTPQIDRLAREGLLATQAHASASVCTPSRYAVLTGENYWRAPAWEGQSLIRADQTTLARTLSAAGYATGYFGKWHLGWGESVPGEKREHRAGGVDWTAETLPSGVLETGYDTYFGTPWSANEPPFVFVRDRAVVGRDPADPISIVGPEVERFYGYGVRPRQRRRPRRAPVGEHRPARDKRGPRIYRGPKGSPLLPPHRLRGAARAHRLRAAIQRPLRHRPLRRHDRADGRLRGAHPRRARLAWHRGQHVCYLHQRQRRDPQPRRAQHRTPLEPRAARPEDRRLAGRGKCAFSRPLAG